MRRALRALSTVLIVSGSLLILDAGLTLVWQEPVSAVYAKLRQNKLAGELRALSDQQPTELQLRALARLRTERRRVAFLARALRRRISTGDAIARIKIPRIGTNFVVVEGTEPGDLREGPGHYPSTPLPGLSGTVAIAGHRTTYLAPFWNLQELRAGDPITLRTTRGAFRYSVTRVFVMPESTAGVVLEPTAKPSLVLTTCDPRFSASQRLIVTADRIG